jgi:hypothetical protein
MPLGSKTAAFTLALVLVIRAEAERRVLAPVSGADGVETQSCGTQRYGTSRHPVGWRVRIAQPASRPGWRGAGPDRRAASNRTANRPEPQGIGGRYALPRIVDNAASPQLTVLGSSPAEPVVPALRQPTPCRSPNRSRNETTHPNAFRRAVSFERIKMSSALHNRERFYLATLRASPQCPIRRLTTPSLARSSFCSVTQLIMQNGSRQESDLKRCCHSDAIVPRLRPGRPASSRSAAAGWPKILWL